MEIQIIEVAELKLFHLSLENLHEIIYLLKLNLRKLHKKPFVLWVLLYFLS